MAIITPPAPLPLRKVRWRLPPKAQTNRSGWTGRSKVLGLPGAEFWTVRGEFVTQIGADAALPWKAFFFRLRGPMNSFRLRAVEKQQTTVTNARVAGGDGGTNITLYGLPPSQIVLRAGHMMTVPLPSGHERLVGLTADIVADAAGQAAVSFAPELGEVPVVGTLVEIVWPHALLRFTGEDPGWDVEPGQTYIFPFQAEEAL